MKLIRTIAMYTDHTYHGRPCETSRVTLFINEEMITPEVIDTAKELQEKRLLSMAKRMPHSFWKIQ